MYNINLCAKQITYSFNGTLPFFLVGIKKHGDHLFANGGFFLSVLSVLLKSMLRYSILD